MACTGNWSAWWWKIASVITAATWSLPRAFEQAVPGKLLHGFCAFRCFLDLFTMQSREGVVRVAADFGSSRNNRVDFESEESLSKFISNMVSITTWMHDAWLLMHHLWCMHACVHYCYRRAIQAATKLVTAKTVVCSWSIPMLKLCSHQQQSWAVTWTSSALLILCAQQIEKRVVDQNHINFVPRRNAAQARYADTHLSMIRVNSKLDCWHSI